jgi:hypothetical protein
MLLVYGCNMDLNYWRLCCIHSFELQWCIVLISICCIDYHVVLNVTVFGKVHSCTLFTIAIDFLLAEFVGRKIVITNGTVFNVSGNLLWNVEGILVQLSFTWNWNQQTARFISWYSSPCQNQTIYWSITWLLSSALSSLASSAVLIHTTDAERR